MSDLQQAILAVLVAMLLLVATLVLAPELITGRRTATEPVTPGTKPEIIQPTPLPPGQGKDVTVMVIIPEICIQRQVPDPAAETALIRELILNNFRVVDQSQVKKIRYNDTTLLAAHGDKEAMKAIQALALEYDADLLLIGEAFGEGAGMAPGGFQSVRARVEVRGVMTRTGQIVISEAETQGGADVTPNVACKKALQITGELIGKNRVVPLLEARFGKQSGAQDKVELIVTSMPFSLYSLFKQKLLTLPEVKGVIADHYSDQQSQVSVNYTGELMDLVNKIVALDLNGYHLEVLTFSNTRVSFKLVKS